MNNNLIQNTSFNFVIYIIELYKILIIRNKYIISRQLFYSAKSIRINVKKGIYRQSRSDFITKLLILLKEVVEIKYWSKLLQKLRLIDINFKKYLLKVINISNFLIKILKALKKINFKNHF